MASRKFGQFLTPLPICHALIASCPRPYTRLPKNALRPPRVPSIFDQKEMESQKSRWKVETLF